MIFTLINIFCELETLPNMSVMKRQKKKKKGGGGVGFDFVFIHSRISTLIQS